MVPRLAAGSFTDEREKQKLANNNRRAKNRVIYMKFAKEAAANGREVSMAELDDFRTQLAGGDNYAVGTIPYGEALTAFKQNNDLLAADAREKRATAKVQREDDDRKIARDIASKLADGSEADFAKGWVNANGGPERADSMLALIGKDISAAYQTARRENVSKVMQDERVNALYSSDDVTLTFPGQPPYIVDALNKQMKNNVATRLAQRQAAAVGGLSPSGPGAGGGSSFTAAIGTALLTAYKAGGETRETAIKSRVKQLLIAAKLDSTPENEEIVRTPLIAAIKSRIADDTVAAVKAALDDVIAIKDGAFASLETLEPDQVEPLMEAWLGSILKANGVVDPEDEKIIRNALMSRAKAATLKGDVAEETAFETSLSTDETLQALILTGTKLDIAKQINYLAEKVNFRPGGGVMSSASVTTFLKAASAMKEIADRKQFQIDSAAVMANLAASSTAMMTQFEARMASLSKTDSHPNADNNTAYKAAAEALVAARLLPMSADGDAVFQTIVKTVDAHLAANEGDTLGAITLAHQTVRAEHVMVDGAEFARVRADAQIFDRYGLEPDSRFGTRTDGGMFNETIDVAEKDIIWLSKLMARTPSNNAASVSSQKSRVLNNITKLISELKNEKIIHGWRIVDPLNFDALMAALEEKRLQVVALKPTADSTLDPSAIAPHADFGGDGEITPATVVGGDVLSQAEIDQANLVEQSQEQAPSRTAERNITLAIGKAVYEKFAARPKTFTQAPNESTGAFNARIQGVLNKVVYEMILENPSLAGKAEDLVHSIKEAIIANNGIGNYFASTEE